MNTYELIYCFKPTLDPDSVEVAIRNVEGYITNLEGKILKTDKVGRKKLAYDVRKFRDGFYANTLFELSPDNIVKLRRNLKLNDNVIREMILKIEKEGSLKKLSSSKKEEVPSRK